MANMTYSEIQDFLNKKDIAGLPRLNISILRNVMIEAAVPYVHYFSYEMGYGCQLSIGDYDNIVQEALGSKNGLITPDTDCIFVFMRLENLSWSLARNFLALDPKGLEAEMARIKDLIAAVISGIRKQTRGMILWHGFESPLYPNSGVCDPQSARGQIHAIHDLNNFLRDSLADARNAYCVDLNCCLMRIGGQKFYDQRYWHIGRAPYSREGLLEIVSEDFKFIRALKGKNKKCLVLDCDNVLWGGIIGEDGLSGIKLGKTYPGSAYYEFQQEIVSLCNRGVLLALCSKNNPDDVLEVIRQHPDMLIKEKHLATTEINWDDKVSNLRKIAANLNIALDSLVFVDDSDFEVNLVRRSLPEVAVLHFSKDKAVEFREMLASCGLFDTLTISAEDRERGEMYRGEAQRKQLMAKGGNLDDYLKSLEMVAEIRLANEFTTPRIAQLTQKTNQFNLTTRRYSDSDVLSFVERPDMAVFSLRLIDKFGDSGIVGVCILKYEGQNAIFDTLLLSCRVLGRGVEDLFLSYVLRAAKAKGCAFGIGEFIPTAKNLQAKDFYVRNGFEVDSECCEGNKLKFSLNLTKPITPGPKHIKIKD